MIKAVSRGKFNSINAYVKKSARHQINELTIHLKALKKEIIKTRKNISKQSQQKQSIYKFNESKSWFFEKINKIVSPLARLIIIKKKVCEVEDKTQINWIIAKKENITRNNLDITGIIRNY